MAGRFWRVGALLYVARLPSTRLSQFLSPAPWHLQAWLVTVLLVSVLGLYGDWFVTQL